jgi:predicted acyltransferase
MKRLNSIDTLRGLDMFFICGGGTFIKLLEGKTGINWVDSLAVQFTHPEWNGFTFYDFIFPLFLFLAGVSLAISINNSIQKGITKKDILNKAFRRMIVLILLGIIDKNNPILFFDYSQIRFGTVLGRIGIAAFFGAVVFINYRKYLLHISLSILVIYYAALFLIPVPGYGTGNLTLEGNLAGWIDRLLMPGRLLQKDYDELGLLTQLPALTLTIFGSIAGNILIKTSNTHQKMKELVLFGIIGIIGGLIWSLHFPINKHLWSSSFIMLTGGLSFLSLSVFHYLIDIKEYTRFTFFFRIIGLNSLVIYLAMSLFNLKYTASKLFKGLYMPINEEWHPVFVSIGTLIIAWSIVYFLYKRKVFIKI